VVLFVSELSVERNGRPPMNSIDHLMNQRLAKWERRRELAREAAKLATVQQPLVVISRDCGSKGHFIAEGVATKLGFDLYDRELINAIAKSAHVRSQVVESVGEQTRQHLSAWIDSRLEGGYFTSTDYLQHLCKIVLSIGQHGQAVMLGRGAQFILNPEQTLRVRIIAPQETRVHRIAASQRLPTPEARAHVLRVDAERNAYCRWHFNADPANPRHYDLILNTALISPEYCVEAVARAFEARFLQQ